MKLSVVSTLFRSAAYVREFHARAGAAARTFAGDNYEIILVNDGSPDESLDIAVALGQADPHLVVVDLSRNFGHHKAMMTGLMHAVGDRVFLIDSDLEECPEWLPDFAAQMAEQESDVVYGVQERRNDPFWGRLAGRLFYKLFRLCTGLDVPDNVMVVRLMSRRYVDALLQHRDREVFMAGLWAVTGFAQAPRQVHKASKGATTYTLRRKISLFINSLASFSSAPLVGIFALGVLISAFAFTYICYLVVNWFFLARPMSGWTSVIASVWLLGGINTAFIGVVGIYVAKIFSEVKSRPYTIVRAVYGARRRSVT